MLSTTFWIQFLGIIFGLAMMYFTFVKYKRKELDSLELIFWFMGWIIVIFVGIVPSILDFIIAPLHFYRRLDFFVVVGFFVIIALAFYNHGTVKKMERKLEFFVRRQALQDQERTKK